MAFGKIIKSNQKGDILTYLKLGNFWDWINSVVKYPNKRHLYKKPKYQIFKQWKFTWKYKIPFIKKSAIRYKNVSKSLIGVQLKSTYVFFLNVISSLSSLPEIITYCISANSCCDNYSFLELKLRKYSMEETIQRRKLFFS